MDVHVRGIDPEVWKELRVEALQRGLSVAKLIEELWRKRQSAQDVDPSQDARVAAIHSGLGRCDAWGNDRGLKPTGIYSAAWWWDPKTGNSTAFADRKLWFAQDDDVPDRDQD